jgi:hypothetical protein
MIVCLTPAATIQSLGDLVASHSDSARLLLCRLTEFLQKLGRESGPHPVYVQLPCISQLERPQQLAATILSDDSPDRKIIATVFPGYGDEFVVSVPAVDQFPWPNAMRTFC